MQSNAVAEQLKDQMADKQAKRQMLIDDNVKAWEYMIAKLKVSQADAAIDKQAVTDILTSGMPIPQMPQQEGTPPQQPEVQPDQPTQ
jgi:predicted secreted protein